MDMWYWLPEYGKVFLGYMFLMFLWPSVVFRSHLRGKSKTYYFGFCVAVPIIIINTTVLTLGIFHILSAKAIFLIFYGIFWFTFVKHMILHFSKNKVSCKNISWLRIQIRIKESIYCFGEKLVSGVRKYGALGLVTLYGMIYFSYGAFQIYSYGYGDLYTHHRWIYSLTQGEIFPDGVYPEAMHCFIYCMHTLFGIKVYSILLFLQIIHVMVFILAAYLLLRKIFCWRYTPVLVLLLFLTLDLSNADAIHSMFRLQITLPQEFGLHTVFLCALYLFEYLHKKNIDTRRDESLFLLLLSAMAALMIHFHVALMAVVLCISVAVFAWKKILSRKYFFPLALSAICACMVAFMPMAGALAQGVPLNSSIYWAVNAMNGEESRALRGQNEKKADIAEEGENQTKIERNDVSITASVLQGIFDIYRKGYSALYGKEGGGWIFLFTVLASVFCWQIKRKPCLKQFRGMCEGYYFVIAASVIYVFVYAAPTIGLPDIIPEGRFFAPGHIMVLAVMAMPFDMAFFRLSAFCKDFTLRIISLSSMLGVYGLSVATGNFRGFLFYELSRYNSAAMVTDSIIDTFPVHSYTIVSPTDELYPVIQYGWHEELLTFVENSSKGEYVIPSEYVFIYVEKRPLLYAQSHFFHGPSWLGEEKYLEPFWKVYSVKYPDNGASQAPEIIAGQASEDMAGQELPEYENGWQMYSDFDKRIILESKVYEWCQKFSEKNPSVLKVYYEDDDFVCYYFRQEAGKLPYELGLVEAGAEYE